MENQKPSPTEVAEKIATDAQAELGVAEGLKTEAQTAFDQASGSELDELNRTIETNNMIWGAMLETDVKENLDEIGKHGNFAAALAKTTSGADVSKDITAAAKSIKAALDSIEKTYPEAEAMQARVMSVDKVDEKETKALVKDYTKLTRRAAILAENCKKSAVQIAVESTGDLKFNVDGKISEVAALPALIQALGKDLESIAQEKQKTIDEDKKAFEELMLKINTLEFEKIKSDLAFTSKNAANNTFIPVEDVAPSVEDVAPPVEDADPQE